MKLYSNDLSPFASRAKMAIRAKGLDIEILDPPGGTKSDAYLALNPMGKIPALVLDDGTVIPESDTIVEYLEDAFPTRNPLRPKNPVDIARARLVARVAELYVLAHGAGLFGQMNPATRDNAAVADMLDRTDAGLAHLNVVMGDGPYAVGATLSTADCALVPFVFYFGVFSQVFGRNLVAGHSKLAAYAAFIPSDPVAASILGDLQAALQARMAPQPA
jgi:glutathione S-transferase